MHPFLSSSSKKPKLRKNWNYKWFHFYKLLLSWLKKRREKWWWLARETHFHKWRKKKTNKRNNSKWVLFYYYNIYPVSHHQKNERKGKRNHFQLSLSSISPWLMFFFLHPIFYFYLLWDPFRKWNLLFFSKKFKPQKQTQ